MSSKPTQFSCSQVTCPEYLSVLHRDKPRKNDIPLDKIDLNHLYRDHLRTYAEYIGHLYGLSEARAAKLEQENARLRAQLGSHAQAGKVAVRSQVLDVTADPRNHVDGFCDHLVANGNALYKCCDTVRHGKKVCALHLDSKTTIEPPPVKPTQVKPAAGIVADTPAKPTDTPKVAWDTEPEVNVTAMEPKDAKEPKDPNTVGKHGKKAKMSGK